MERERERLQRENAAGRRLRGRDQSARPVPRADGGDPATRLGRAGPPRCGYDHRARRGCGARPSLEPIPRRDRHARIDPGDAALCAALGAVELAAIFSFLVDPRLEATNWRVEQALRPAIVTREMCGGGNRFDRGAHSRQVLASILRTAQLRELDGIDVLTTLLGGSGPIVSPHV